jgi:hypothetical protein
MRCACAAFCMHSLLYVALLCRFVVAVIALPMLYYNGFLSVDAEEFSPSELLQEGFMPALGVFLIFWILSYTYVEQQFLPVKMNA